MIALVLIGPSGSGKTVLGRQAAEELGLTYIGSGEIARKIADADHFAKAGLDRGDWAPELAMRAEVLARIEAAVVATGDFVLDGFPRTLEQLYILESVKGIHPVYFVIQVDTLICFRRLITRGRDDDHPDAVMTRYRNYQEQTIPVLEVLDEAAYSLDGVFEPDMLLEDMASVYRQRRAALA